MGKFRIISFDGGGIKGALSIAILKRISDKYPEVIEKTDLFAGTSTGSFIALGLAKGMEPSDILDMYRERGSYIFDSKNMELFRPKYDNTNLIEVLNETFHPRTRLLDLNSYVVVPAFKVKGGRRGNWSPVFFNNLPTSDNKHEHVVDVALASSAAPVYFPSYKNHIDGAVIANNPSIPAISIAIDKFGGAKNLDDIHLISIGTGFNPSKINSDTSNWGLIEWQLNSKVPFPLETIMIEGAIEANSYYSSQLLQERYLRINPKLIRSIGLDDHDKISYLIAMANRLDLGDAIKWIERKWLL